MRLKPLTFVFNQTCPDFILFKWRIPQDQVCSCWTFSVCVICSSLTSAFSTVHPCLLKSCKRNSRTKCCDLIPRLSLTVRSVHNGWALHSCSLSRFRVDKMQKKCSENANRHLSLHPWASAGVMWWSSCQCSVLRWSACGHEVQTRVLFYVKKSPDSLVSKHLSCLKARRKNTIQNRLI